MYQARTCPGQTRFVCGFFRSSMPDGFSPERQASYAVFADMERAAGTKGAIR
jgi:hypothetical protein